MLSLPLTLMWLKTAASECFFGEGDVHWMDVLIKLGLECSQRGRSAEVPVLRIADGEEGRHKGVACTRVHACACLCVCVIVHGPVHVPVSVWRSDAEGQKASQRAGGEMKGGQAQQRQRSRSLPRAWSKWVFQGESSWAQTLLSRDHICS